MIKILETMRCDPLITNADNGNRCNRLGGYDKFNRLHKKKLQVIAGSFILINAVTL